ncbi:hypothetical protein NEMBOFW57_009507 [Staphylotrichum longicolle]|uniref:G domain-containing protein n=1 Tax=Staphylotrichum longicolle TaxID=669026 RepID=A0AAD4EP58_9PEZI|nr:hypothetical protein NEMBOFW57_009507 [Staphylotrichum longicolle]
MSRTSEDEAERPLVFVGHSLGGLVIKEALIRSSEYHFNKQDEQLGAVYPCTKGIVFLGTPHRGSDLIPYGHIVAKVAKLLLRDPNERLISLLESESPILERQRKSFASINKDIGLACVIEELPTALGIVVPEWSATIDGFNVKHQQVLANHMDMCKFANREEVGYRRVVFLLNNILRRKFQRSLERLDSLPEASFDAANKQHVATYLPDTRRDPAAPPSPDDPFHNMSARLEMIDVGKLSYSGVRNRRPNIGGRRRSPKEVVIAVMGETGSGKSTFISNLAARDYQSSVGHGLSSRTQEVVEADCSIDGCSVVLVDTPGFDDINHEDGTILSRIGQWLDLSYHEGKRLSGLIFMHDVTQPRIGRSNVRNMTLFRKITGNDNMKNVTLLTTKWEILPDQAIGVRRENELHEEPGFWNRMLADDAQSRRHDGTKESALAIIRELLKKDPVVLRMQQQMAEGADIVNTEAGEFVNEEYLRLQKQHREDMEMKEAKENLERRLQAVERMLDHAQSALSESKAAAQKATQAQEQLAESLQQETSGLRTGLLRRGEEDDEAASMIMEQKEREDAQAVVMWQRQHQVVAQERQRREESEREARVNLRLDLGMFGVMCKARKVS